MPLTAVSEASPRGSGVHRRPTYVRQPTGRGCVVETAPPGNLRKVLLSPNPS